MIILFTGIDFLTTTYLSPLLNGRTLMGIRIEAPASMTILGLILYIYDKWLWKMPLFKLIMNVPNMSGRYKGGVRFVKDGEKRELPAYIEISQTSSNLKIHTYFKDSREVSTNSQSLIEEIILGNNGFYDIYFFYLNTGSKQSGELDCHEGANVIRFHPKQGNDVQSLAGYYFTNRSVQTRGEIFGEYESATLKGKF